MSGYGRIEQAFASEQYGVQQIKTYTVDCPVGQKVIGGGWRATVGAGAPLTSVGEYPSTDSQWTVQLTTNVGQSALVVNVTAYAICANTL